MNVLLCFSFSTRALHHVSPEGDSPFRPHRLAAQSLLLPDRQVVCDIIFIIIIWFFFSLSNRREITCCLADRWVASGGDNMVCGCCETSCNQQGRHRRHAASSPQQVALEGTASLGPITLEGSVLEVALPSKPAALSQTQETSRAGEANKLTSVLKQKPLWWQLPAANGTDATYLLSLLLVHSPTVRCRCSTGGARPRQCGILPQTAKISRPQCSHLIWGNKSISDWVFSLDSFFFFLN